MTARGAGGAMENEWTKRIKELEDEVAKLIADRDADRKREYGYSQQTVDALTAERDKLEAENKRLREDVAILRAATTFFAGELDPRNR